MSNRTKLIVKFWGLDSCLLYKPTCVKPQVDTQPQSEHVRFHFLSNAVVCFKEGKTHVLNTRVPLCQRILAFYFFS